MINFNDAQVQKVFSDEAFVKSLLELEEPEDVQAALKDKGIDCTIDEIKQLGEKINKAVETYLAQQNGDDLSIEQLDDVAGGFGGGFDITDIGLVEAAITVGKAIGKFFKKW